MKTANDLLGLVEDVAEKLVPLETFTDDTLGQIPQIKAALDKAEVGYDFIDSTNPEGKARTILMVSRRTQGQAKAILDNTLSGLNIGDEA